MEQHKQTHNFQIKEDYGTIKIKDGQISCLECETVFSSIKTAKMHLKIAHLTEEKSIPKVFDRCSPVKIDYLKPHRNAQKLQSDQLICKICKNDFMSKDEIKDHMELHNVPNTVTQPPTAWQEPNPKSYPEFVAQIKKWLRLNDGREATAINDRSVKCVCNKIIRIRCKYYWKYLIQKPTLKNGKVEHKGKDYS